ncbi:MAG: hypothetical protein AAB887_00760 [Patescibacteria group bacterium]
MALYLGILIFSFIITSIAIVPFIDFLYSKKKGTPVGGGILMITIVTLLYVLLFPLIIRLGVYITSAFPIKEELNIIFFTFISFGLLGLYKSRFRWVIQALLALAVSALLYFNLKIDIINVPFLGVLNLGVWFVPLSTAVIMAFTNAFDITDGLDGLSCGSLLICLLAFWALAVTSLDTPLSIFIALWIGSLIAFLYFNVYPARLRLGQAGSLSFGASLAVVGLLLGKTVALLVIGGIFVIELISFAHRRLQKVGWEEPKIVMRAWLAGIMLAVFGLWLAQL